jgi:hypothetical protein
MINTPRMVNDHVLPSGCQCTITPNKMEEEKMRLVAAVALCNLLSTLTSLYHWNLVLINLASATFVKLRQRLCNVGRNSGKVCKLRKKRPRTCWVRPGRTDVWWENFLNDVVVAKERKENFRMGKYNFFKLCDELRPFLEKKSTSMRHPISVEKQVAVTLYYLSDEGRLRKAANAFGIGRSTVSTIIRNVTYVLAVFLGPRYIKLPTSEEEVMDKVENFHSQYGVPQ